MGHRAQPGATTGHPRAFRHSSLRGINRQDERLDPQAWLTDVLSRIAAIPAQAFIDFGVESLVELIKIHRESTRPENAEINDERRPAAAHPGRLLRILMKFVNKP